MFSVKIYNQASGKEFIYSREVAEEQAMAVVVFLENMVLSSETTLPTDPNTGDSTNDNQ